MKLCDATIDLATNIIKAAYTFRATAPVDAQPVVKVSIHMSRINASPITGSLAAVNEDGSLVHIFVWTHIDPLLVSKTSDTRFMLFRSPSPESKLIVTFEWDAQSFVVFAKEFMAEVIGAMEGLQ